MSSSDHTTSWEANPYEIKVPIFGRSLCANFTDKSPASQVDNYSQDQVKKKVLSLFSLVHMCKVIICFVLLSVTLIPGLIHSLFSHVTNSVCHVTNSVCHVTNSVSRIYYRIAGLFHGRKFSRISQIRPSLRKYYSRILHAHAVPACACLFRSRGCG